MKLFYVYILKCSDGSYYTGFTKDIEQRVLQHNTGLSLSAYTYARRPVELVWVETFTDPNIAIDFEKKLKGWSRRKKEALIKEDWDKLVAFSKNYTQFGKPKEDNE
ncbi:GIY-YIG nuclease family protein [Flavobacterium sp. J372]|uniref:GIY-YIG nuclease family protein n=1 Tax=Flavobacterium sp. J372 TaxID=2898436 RepID=UPI0021517FAE|nr:GIY-YIG nuclease family protein [Flavobacterium sp. J372]MCR5863000.1 GIY-YIG nuclease family protein [Flavobacterium sp. J372]